MSTRIRWAFVAAALAGCVGFVLHALRTPAKTPIPAAAKIQPSLPSQPAGAARALSSALKVIPERVDFGKVPVGETRSLTLRVQNSGPEKVTVQKLELPCGCLKADMESREIHPGGSRNLNLTFTAITGRRSENYTIFLPTDEPRRPRVALPVHGKSVEVIKIEPEMLSFGQLAKNVPKTLEAVVRRKDGAAFKITEVKTQRPELAVTVEPAETGKEHKLRVTVRGLRVGWIGETLSTLTPESPLPMGLLTLSGEVESDIKMTPPVATAALDAENHAGPLETVLQCSTPGQLSVEEVRACDSRC